MKETFYFSHDYNARTDDKIKKLIRKYGMQGYGLYWALVEDLYNNANALQLDYEGLAFDYRVEEELIRSLIGDYELFIIDLDKFYSQSVQDRLDKRDEKSAKARDNANKRWNKKDANALQTHSEGNAIKESKLKKSIVNNKKEIHKFQIYIDLFIEHRKNNKSPLTDRALKIFITKIEKYSELDIKRELDKTIFNNWKDIYLDKCLPINTEIKDIGF